ncbi:MAG: (d)CMP kinase [Desulfobacterales bacterium]|nr:MAG: (d)CMP kinase [Desulfobacterales bacterium]
MKKLLITIDGPAGAGKTTVSRRLADRLGYKYIDTGALYRGVAYVARAQGIGPDDDGGLQRLAKQLDLSFEPSAQGLRLIANGQDITDKIRTPEITMLASAVSARPALRAYLLGVQRDMGRGKGAVFEGRDMGTVVFPEADVKFFLDASPKTRAFRRFTELQACASQTLAEVERDINRRDQNDSTRDLAPLKPAADAIIIDSTDLSVEEVVARMATCISDRLDGEV